MQIDRLRTCGSQLLIFKVCGVIGISKSNFSIFPVLKGLDKIKKIKNHLKPPDLVRQPLFKQFQQNFNFFWFFIENLTPLLSGTHCASSNTDLPLKVISRKR